MSNNFIDESVMSNDLNMIEYVPVAPPVAPPKWNKAKFVAEVEGCGVNELEISDLTEAERESFNKWMTRD